MATDGSHDPYRRQYNSSSGAPGSGSVMWVRVQYCNNSAFGSGTVMWVRGQYNSSTAVGGAPPAAPAAFPTLKVGEEEEEEEEDAAA